MPDPAIQIGDVCIDLVERGKVQVVQQAAATVEEHRQYNDYDVAAWKANALLDVQDDEPVYKCVYLTENPSPSFSGTYDFPRSRLARQPVEEAHENLERIQWEHHVEVLRRLFAVALGGDTMVSESELAELAELAGIDPELVDVAWEVAASERPQEDRDAE